MPEQSQDSLKTWFRRGWWAVLAIGLGALLYRRLPALASGTATPVDFALLAIWIGLLLAPLFTEVSVFGVSLKTELAQLRSDVKTDLANLRVELQQALSVQTTLNQHIALAPLAAPAPDQQLRALEHRITEIVGDALRAAGKPALPEPLAPPAHEDQLLYSARVELEREMRRIVRQRELTPYGPRVVRPMDLATLLVHAELISADMAKAIREVYLICSRAIHAEPVTPAQRAFVQQAAPGLIAALKATD